MRVLVRVEGTKRWQEVMRSLAPKSTGLVRNALKVLALEVQRVATTQKIRLGAAKSPPIPGRVTARNFGRGGLVGSIGVDLRETYADVGSDLVYAPLHELGLTVPVPAHVRTRNGKRYSVRAYRAHFPERPYLKPALDDVYDRAPDMLLKMQLQLLP